MKNEKLMANCTKAVDGIVDAVMRYTSDDGRKKSFPDTPHNRRVAFSYTMQEFNKRLNVTPFSVDHCDICEAVRERMATEGYLQ